MLLQEFLQMLADTEDRQHLRAEPSILLPKTDTRIMILFIFGY